MSELHSKFSNTLEKTLLGLFVDDTELNQAAQYAIFPAGKRLRPICAMTICTDLGGCLEQVVPAAAALELIHCSTLVHDDLPCMDDDDVRRGKPSVHKQFGEATGLLVGDYLVGRAFELIASLGSVATNELARAYSQVCNGQYLDIIDKDSKDSCLLDTIKKIHVQKTAALFSASFAIGAIAAQADTQVIQSGQKLGELFGLLFQAQDDLKDGNERYKARPAGSDHKREKELTLQRCEQDVVTQWVLTLKKEIAHCTQELRDEVGIDFLAVSSVLSLNISGIDSSV